MSCGMPSLQPTCCGYLLALMSKLAVDQSLFIVFLPVTNDTSPARQSLIQEFSDAGSDVQAVADLCQDTYVHLAASEMERFGGLSSNNNAICCHPQTEQGVASGVGPTPCPFSRDLCPTVSSSIGLVLVQALPPPGRVCRVFWGPKVVKLIRTYFADNSKGRVSCCSASDRLPLITVWAEHMTELSKQVRVPDHLAREQSPASSQRLPKFRLHCEDASISLLLRVSSERVAFESKKAFHDSPQALHEKTEAP